MPEGFVDGSYRGHQKPRSGQRMPAGEASARRENRSSRREKFKGVLRREDRRPDFRDALAAVLPIASRPSTVASASRHASRRLAYAAEHRPGTSTAMSSRGHPVEPPAQQFAAVEPARWRCIRVRSVCPRRGWRPAAFCPDQRRYRHPGPLRRRPHRAAQGPRRCAMDLSLARVLIHDACDWGRRPAAAIARLLRNVVHSRRRRAPMRRLR